MSKNDLLNLAVKAILMGILGIFLAVLFTISNIAAGWTPNASPSGNTGLGFLYYFVACFAIVLIVRLLTAARRKPVETTAHDPRSA